MAQPVNPQEQHGIGNDPRYGPTAGQLKTMRDEIARGIKRVEGTSSLPERRRLKAAHDLFLEGVRERLAMLRKEIRYLEWMMAGFAPEQLRGSSNMQLVASVLTESDGRIWLTNLVAACKVFQLPRPTFWAVIHKLEAEGFVKIHESPLSKDGAPSIPSWVEVVSMTGGDGAPPSPPRARVPLAGREPTLTPKGAAWNRFTRKRKGRAEVPR